MQPTFFPWLGYFAMIDSVDKFVFLDNVQLVKRSWQVRNRIKQNDSELMLTVPIVNKSRDKMFINNTCVIQNGDWKRKHLETIKYCYHKAAYFNEIYELITSVYNKQHIFIGSFNIEIIESMCKYMGITTKLVRSSYIENLHGKKDELLVNICKSENIDNYLSALGSASYIEKDIIGGEFSNSNIILEYQNYNHPTYRQIGNIFLPYLGIIDLVFNEGKNSLNVIRNGCANPFSSKDIREANEYNAISEC